MTIQQALNQATRILLCTSASARLDAEVLLCFVIKKEKEYLYTYPEVKLSPTQITKFNSLIAKRAKGIPVAYLVGHKEFFKLDFIVNRHVLVPRPDSELLVSHVLAVCKGRRHTSLQITEIGTGSGAVAISIAKNLPQAKVTACDISAAALKVAARNAKKHQVNIEFHRGDLLTPVKNKKSDIMVANLPYLALTDKKQFSTELNYEPRVALYSGIDGLDHYRRFFEQAGRLRYQPKYILIEHGHHQEIELKKIIRQHLQTKKISFKKDLCGRNRMILVELHESNNNN